MAEYRVWAPRARTAQVEVATSRFSLRREAGGWWRGSFTEVSATSDYRFVLDDGEPIPDPRSPWQPEGVDGPSRTVDHQAFRWTCDSWKPASLGQAIFYELHVGTFSIEGTFQGAIRHLDYLKDLGVTHVELMPTNEFSGSHGWGYDSVMLYSPHHSYGGPDGLKLLIDGCHQRGLAVVADVVYNHFGPVGNYLDRFGPYFTDRYSTPWGKAINLDGPGSDEVRRYFCDHAAMLLRDYRFDGLRLDAVHTIFDMSALQFLEQLANETGELERQLARPPILIAESDLNDPRIIIELSSGGFGLDAQWNDDFHHALHSLLTKEKGGYYADFGSIAQLAKAIEQGYVFDGCYSTFRDRKHGRSPRGLCAHKFIGYLQNHDQIGNRAKGERIGHLTDTSLLKMGAGLVLTAPFVPLLFQGEEWAASTPFLYFTDHRDPELGRNVREGRRREFAAFGWNPEEIPDPQDPETFARSILNWSELSSAPHREILDWYRSLIRLRKEMPALTEPDLSGIRVRFDEQERWITIERGPVSIACNFGRTERTLPCRASNVLLSMRTGVTSDPGAVKLPALTFAVLAR